MNQNNTGIKVALVILVIICLIQMTTMSSMQDKMDDFDYMLSEQRKSIQSLQRQINTLTEKEDKQMDISYKMVGADWETGIVKADFLVNPINVGDNTRVIVSNSKETVELTREGKSFVGTVSYPIDKESYETSVYLYEGDYERTSEVVDYIGASNWSSDIASCGFEGFISYGNGKLTLAGELQYKLDTDEKIKDAKLIFADSTIDLKNDTVGSVAINASENIDEAINTQDLEIQEFYVELLTESGIKYQLSPYIVGWYNFKTGGDEDVSYYIRQESILKVSIPDGKDYEMMLGVIWEE